MTRSRISPARLCSSLERRRALGAPAQTGYRRPALPSLVLHLFEHDVVAATCHDLFWFAKTCKYGGLFISSLPYLHLVLFAGTSRYPWRYPAPPNWQLWQLDQTDDDSVKAIPPGFADC